MESHTKRFLRIFLFSSATFLQYLRSSSSTSFSGHTPPFLPSHFFIQGSYSGSLVFSALEEKEQESEFVAVNPARRSHRYTTHNKANRSLLPRLLVPPLELRTQTQPRTTHLRTINYATTRMTTRAPSVAFFKKWRSKLNFLLCFLAF